MLTPRWHKVIRDLWHNKTKTILVVLAIAVGLFAFGSVYITQDVLVNDMDTQYRAVNSANIVLYTSDFDQNLSGIIFMRTLPVSRSGRSHLYTNARYISELLDNSAI